MSKKKLNIIYLRDGEAKSQAKQLEVEVVTTVREIILKCLGLFHGEIEEEGGEFYLSYGNTYLKRDIKFSEVKCTRGNTFYLSCLPRSVEKFGAGFVLTPVSTNASLDRPIINYEKIMNEDYLPRHRIFGKGLNVEIECEQVQCELKGEKQIFVFGEGTFDAVDFHLQKCMECNNQVTNVRTVGFRDCRYRILFIQAIQCVNKKFKSKWIKVPDKRCWLGGKMEEKYFRLEFEVEINKK